MPSSTLPAKNRRKRLRWLPYAAGALLLVGLILGLRPAPSVVETGLVEHGSLRTTVSEEGKTRIRQHYILSSPISGFLHRVELKPGAPLKAGETLLATLDALPSSPLDARTRAQALARRDAASAQVEKSRSNAELAHRDLQRFEAMEAAHSLSTQDLEAARMREIAASRDLSNAEAALRLAEAELGAFTDAGSETSLSLRPAITGVLLTVFQESARPIAQGTPILEYGDPSDLEIVAEMLSRDGAAIRPGAEVSVEQWGGAEPLQGRVRLVEPAAFTKISALGVEEQRVNVVIDLITPLAQRASLGDHFRVECRVVLWEGREVLKAPAAGVFRHGQAWASYVIRDGRASLVPVKVGHNGGREVEILEGLQSGDRVILYPGDRIQPGLRVKAAQIVE